MASHASRSVAAASGWPSAWRASPSARSTSGRASALGGSRSARSSWAAAISGAPWARASRAAATSVSTTHGSPAGGAAVRCVARTDGDVTPRRCSRRAAAPWAAARSTAGQAIGDRGADEGMAELQRGRVGQHVGRNQRRRGRPRVVDGHPGERRRHLEVAAVAEDDDRVGDRTRPGRQARPSTARHDGRCAPCRGSPAVWPQRRPGRRRRAVSVSRSSTSSALPPVASTTAETNSAGGRRAKPRFRERRHRLRAERPRRERRPARFRDDRLDLRARLPGQRGAGGRGDRRPAALRGGARGRRGTRGSARRPTGGRRRRAARAILEHRQVRDQPVQAMQDGEAVARHRPPRGRPRAPPATPRPRAAPRAARRQPGRPPARAAA